MSFIDVFHDVVNVLSLGAAIISVSFFIYFLLRIRTLNPFLLFAVSSAKAVMSSRLRNIVLLTFLSTLIFFIAYSEKYFVGNKVVYWTLEASSLLIFLVAGVLLIFVEFGRRKPL